MCVCVCANVKDSFSAGIKPKESKKEFFPFREGEGGTLLHTIKKTDLLQNPLTKNKEAA